VTYTITLTTEELFKIEVALHARIEMATKELAECEAQSVDSTITVYWRNMVTDLRKLSARLYATAQDNRQ
jgi:hypothetical protein